MHVLLNPLSPCWGSRDSGGHRAWQLSRCLPEPPAWCHRRARRGLRALGTLPYRVNSRGFLTPLLVVFSQLRCAHPWSTQVSPCPLPRSARPGRGLAEQHDLRLLQHRHVHSRLQARLRPARQNLPRTHGECHFWPRAPASREAALRHCRGLDSSRCGQAAAPGPTLR